MIVIKTDKAIKQFLDEASFKSITEKMYSDCPEFAESINPKEGEWIGRVICTTGSDQDGSNIPFGYLLRYQFRVIDIGYDLGIKDIKIAESTDEFLDLINEIKRNPAVFNVNSTGK